MSLTILLCQFYVTCNQKTYLGLQVKGLVTLFNNSQLWQHEWNMHSLLIQVCWEQKWKARYKMHTDFVFYCAYLPLQMALVLLSPTPLNTTALWRLNPRWKAQKQNFEWQEHINFVTFFFFCDSSVFTQIQGQRLRPKVKGKEKWRARGGKWHLEGGTLK